MAKRKRPTMKLLAWSFCLAFFLGILFCRWWVYVGVTDEFCELRDDGTGWMSLSIRNDHVYCVPRLIGFLFGGIYFGLLFFIIPSMGFVYLMYSRFFESQKLSGQSNNVK